MPINIWYIGIFCFPERGFAVREKPQPLTAPEAA